MESDSTGSDTNGAAMTVSQAPKGPLEPVIAICKTLVRCNPFYLFSALLLLYGVYRASIDPKFLSTEARQVVFNFGSLQIYGLMLVGTVCLLARRKIWYDATLLFFIENILVLIPFILLSQAFFLESSLARNLSILGCALVVLKLGVFKGFFTDLNLPRRLLLIGSFIVTVNAAIPLVFRRGLEVDNELWTVRSQYCWLVLLPLLVMAGHVLNPLRVECESEQTTEEHRKQWLPLVTFLLWIIGTAAHLYSIGYVDDQKFELAKFSILVWAIAWLLCAKITLLLSRFTPAAGEIMLSLPIVTTLLAVGRPEIAITLNILNGGIYGILCLRWKAIRLPAVLAGVSLVIGLLSVPNDWITPYVKEYEKSGVLFSLIAAVLVIKAILTPVARWAFIGALIIAVFLFIIGQSLRFSPLYGVHIASSFLLIHSLFWKGPQERGATFLLLLAAIILLYDSFALAGKNTFALRALPYLTGVPMLLMVFLFRRAAVPIIATVGSMLVLPLSYAASATQAAPAGILALSGSFILFAFGTAFAIWRGRFSDSANGKKETSV